MWEYLLHRFLGVGDDDRTQVRLGAGVVGHTTYAIISVCVVIGGIAWAMRDAPLYAIFMALIIAAILLVFLIGTWRFAKGFPDQAVMGGSEWVRFREAQFSQIASKNNINLTALPAMSEPNTSDGSDDTCSISRTVTYDQPFPTHII